MTKRIFEKLNRINSKEEVLFKIEYKGEVLQKRIIQIPEYAKEIMDDKDLQLYYFFKDIAVYLEDKIEGKIIQLHKEQMWKEINKSEQNDNTNDKSE